MDTSATLLQRLRDPADRAAWQRFHDLYSPLLLGWLHHCDQDLGDESADVLQEVFTVLVQELPTFRRQRHGSFRRWLRTVLLFRLREHWRKKKRRPRPVGGLDQESLLQQLQDPRSELSQAWDQEENLQVLRRVQEMIRRDFQPATWQAFERVEHEGEPAAAVAASLGMTVNAVHIACSRVRRRLREECEDFLK